MITFDQARDIVRAELEPVWDTDCGSFTVAPYGYENETYWAPVAGAAEWLIDENPLYAMDTDEILLVHKETGKLTTKSAIANRELLASLTPVGDVPQD